MCGIAVAFNWPEANAKVARIASLLAHRGAITDPVVSPWPETAFCTRRLPIVDEAGGVQPAVSWDGRILVAMNGEIYNYAELAAELGSLGAKFRTASDTEVLAAALSVWGGRALQRLNGMYAFVALDLGAGEFLAARDPFGVKPLYVVQSGESFLFASEMRPLLTVTESEKVMFLPPGHALTRRGAVQFKSFLTERTRGAGVHDARTLDRILQDAVAIRTPPDLPVATLMSGGIDSTLIAHYLRRIRPEAPGYFLGSPTAPDFRYAAEYADMNDYELRLVDFEDGGGDILGQIDSVVATVESFEPNVVHPSLCSYLLSRAAHRDGFRVGFCGEGADELFAGYVHNEQAYARSEDHGHFVREEGIALMHRSVLQRVDRCSMRFGLELREPFLDPAVATYALGLAGDQLWSRAADGSIRGKRPLRTLYDLYPDALPASIRDRRKIPLNEGSGFDQSEEVSPWAAFARETVSDREFSDGQRRFAPYDLRDKEDYLYLDRLARVLDVDRVPHLAQRSLIRIPV